VGTSTDNLDSVVQRGNTTNTRIIANGGVQTADSVLVFDGVGNIVAGFRTSPFGPPGWASGSMILGTTNGISTIYNTGSIDRGSFTYSFPDTSGTLFVGARINNTTIMAGANGIIDLGTIAGGGIDSIYRTPGVDSIYYTKGANTYAIKDSVGSGGGSTDTTSLSNRIDLKLNTSTYTAAVLDSGWVDWSDSSTIVGWSSFTTKHIRYRRVGKTVYFVINLAGTSNSTSTSITLPYPLSNNSLIVLAPIGRVTNNGASALGWPNWVAGSASLTFQIWSAYGGSSTGTWANSYTKALYFQGFYEID